MILRGLGEVWECAAEEFGGTAACFVNLNTPEDWAEAEKQA